MVCKRRYLNRFVATGLLFAVSGCDDGSSGNSSKDRSNSPDSAPHLRLIPLPEYSGRIQHVVLHSPQGLVGQTWRSVYDLLTAMPPDTRFTLVCNTQAALSETQGRLRQWKFDDRKDIAAILIQQPISIWARDRYIAMARAEAGGLPTWLVPQVVQNFDSERRQQEREVPGLLNEVKPCCRIAETPLVLEGGNVIASKRQVFAGANAFHENTQIGTPAQTKAALEGLFGLPLIMIHDDSGSPPMAHVDMFFTPVADDHVLVGSPALAAEIVKKADSSSAGLLKRRLFITPDVSGGIDASFSPQRARRFDQVAKQLTELGLRVTRIPYVDSRNGDFAVTYNNVIQEQRDGRHIVYMPIYKIPALDDAARRTYESLGMIVKPIDVSPICHLLGAVRCLANVVERSDDE